MPNILTRLVMLRQAKASTENDKVFIKMKNFNVIARPATSFIVIVIKIRQIQLQFYWFIARQNAVTNKQ